MIVRFHLSWKVDLLCLLRWWRFNKFLINITILYPLKTFGQKQPPEVFFIRKGVLRNFVTFTGKHLCQGLVFNKARASFFNKFYEISKNTFFKEHLWATASVWLSGVFRGYEMRTSARNKLKPCLWGYLPMKIVLYYQHVIVHQKSGTYADMRISIHTFTIHLKVGLSPLKKIVLFV